MSNENSWFVIINPTSGKNRSRRLWPKISKKLSSEGIIHSHAFTKRRRHASVLARDAIRKGYRKLIAMGGDGTINEVVNGIMFQKVVSSKEILFAVIPVGTGNDWIRTHRIPRNHDKAIRLIKSNRIKTQDVGMAVFKRHGNTAKRYFANVAGMGYDAFVVRESERRKNFVANKIFYLFLIFASLWKYSLVSARLNTGTETVEKKFYIINIGICKFSGGGMRFVPHAIPDDGRLAYTYAEELSKFQVVLATPKFFNGKVSEHPKVTVGFSETIEVDPVGEVTTLVEVDGEFVGETPAKFSLHAGALRFIAP